MRIKALAFGLFLLLAAVSVAAAQENATRHLVVSLGEGGFVSFKSETAWTSAGAINSSAAAKQMPGEFRSQAFIDADDVVHRVLVDQAGKYVFGYDLVIQAVPASQTFTIAVRPLDVEIESKLLRNSPDDKSASIATLLQSSDPQILDDGDSFTLDLLVNQKTGVKIVDLVRVAFDRTNLREDNPRILPRDFTLDAVALTVSDYRLLIEGNLVASGKQGTTFAGALIWCYVEGHGRFIFSLVPREGYQFQKAGIINENRIEFTVSGHRYEWLSSSPILPSEGTWNVWVLHDPKYVPFGSRETVTREKNKLEKLDDSIKAAAAKAAKIGASNPNTFGKQSGAPKEVREVEAAEQPSSQRFRVMVGAADRMENLWPKN